jgi:hypothetical protein
VSETSLELRKQTFVLAVGLLATRSDSCVRNQLGLLAMEHSFACLLWTLRDLHSLRREQGVELMQKVAEAP